MAPNRLSIIGVGLLGGSIGLAVKSTGNTCHIKGYGHKRETLDKALRIGAIDDAADSPAAAVRDAELVILCTPVGTFEQILRRIGTELKHGAIVTDVGSTKRNVVRLARELLPKGVHFVGSHPMAGSEKRGIDFARADLFQGARCITTPTDQTDPKALDAVEEFWRLLGMTTTRLSPEEHDRLACSISHLPHALAAALVAMQDPAALTLAGKGFLDATRIASGDGGLWRDIFLDNQDNLRASTQQLLQTLNQMLQLLEPGKGDALRDWLNAAATRRETLLREKLREINPD